MVGEGKSGLPPAGPVSPASEGGDGVENNDILCVPPLTRQQDSKTHTNDNGLSPLCLTNNFVAQSGRMSPKEERDSQPRRSGRVQPKMSRDTAYTSKKSNKTG